jgi:V/A-type H+/Na+-transporting ATPase subunit D
MAERIPPGRAGKLWLAGRLDAARRGTELLDRKRQLLRREKERLALVVDERRRSWIEACADAQRWACRAAALGGTGGIALVAGAVAGRATVTVSWRNTMGVSHPDDAVCAFPVLAPTEIAAASAALGPTVAAHRHALECAVSCAVADAALRRIEEELHATQRRLRAIERHRMPYLQGALGELQLRLDELERQERVVTRWALRRRNHEDRGPS